MSNLLKSKFFLGALVVAVMFVGAVAVKATPAKAACTITMTLKVGSTGEEVKCLQAAVGAIADGIFGPATKAKVATWQASVGLTVDGVFGPMSRAAWMGGSTGSTGGTYPAGCTSTSGFSTTTGMPCTSSTTLPAGCTSTAGYSPTTGAKCDSGSTTGGSTGPLTGGAGSITLTALSTYGAEEVGEGEEDVEVLSLDIEADDDSDVEITSVKVELNQQTAADSEDLTDYAESVSVWLDGKEVGRADAEDFTENSDVYTKSISLDGAVIEAGDELELVLAVTALNNLDSGDIDSDDWQIGISNVRFVDAEGVVTTESVTLDIDDDTLDDAHEEAFHFTDFATSSNAELKVALNDDEDAINEAHVINVETTDDNDDVEVLAFTLEAEGDSDLYVTEIPVLFTTTGETDEAVILNTARLWMDGDVLATDDVPTGGAVVFEDVDFTIKAGDEVELLVTVDVEDLPGALDAGDTVKAELTGTQVDAIEAEDESGEDLGTADLTGTALGEASEFRDVGMVVELSGTPSVVKSNGEQAVNSDSALFTITFDVTAFDGDVFIDKTAPDATGGTTESDVNMTGAGTLLCSIDTTTGATEGTDGFEVEEDTTETFQVVCDVRDGGTDLVDGFFDIALTDIRYALSDIEGAISYTFNLDDFKTSQVFLDDRE